MTKTVAIYRHQIGKPSETFIYTPLKYYSEYKPCLIGTEMWPKSEVITDFFVPRHFTRLSRIFHRLTRRNRAMNEWFNHNKPSIIHAHFAIDGLYAAYYSNKFDIPLVVTLHGFDVTRTKKELILSGNLSWLMYALLQKVLFRHCDLFICVSDFIKRKAIDAGFPEEKLVTQYIGIDTHLFKPRTDREKSPPKTSFNILHVARLTEKKGTAFLIDALYQLNNEQYKLTIAGDGELLGILEKKVKHLNLTSQVRFLGFVSYERIKTLMQESNVLCVPSITAKDGDAEGLGMVFLEAAATGLPIIATKHGGIPEAVSNRETGILVNERSSSELASAIQELAQSPKSQQHMSIYAHTWVKNKFNIEKNTRELELKYNRLIGKKT